MIVYTRDELIKMFNMCGDLARYHIEASKVAFACNRDDAKHHMNMTDKYIAIREDIMKILTEGA